MNEELAEKTFELNKVRVRLADHLQKLYSVEGRNGNGWQDVREFGSRDDANAFAKRQAGPVRVRMKCVTLAPTKSFWDIWRDPKGKFALKEAGIFVAKERGSFVVVVRETIHHPAEMDKPLASARREISGGKFRAALSTPHSP